MGGEESVFVGTTRWNREVPQRSYLPATSRASKGLVGIILRSRALTNSWIESSASATTPTWSGDSVTNEQSDAGGSSVDRHERTDGDGRSSFVIREENRSEVALVDRPSPGLRPPTGRETVRNTSMQVASGVRGISSHGSPHRPHRARETCAASRTRTLASRVGSTPALRNKMPPRSNRDGLANDHRIISCARIARNQARRAARQTRAARRLMGLVVHVRVRAAWRTCSGMASPDDGAHGSEAKRPTECRSMKKQCTQQQRTTRPSDTRCTSASRRNSSSKAASTTRSRASVTSSSSGR